MWDEEFFLDHSAHVRHTEIMSQLPKWAPYAVPFFLFLGITTLESSMPGHYPLIYTLKVLVVGISLFVLRPRLGDGRVSLRNGAIAAVVGLALTAIWVALDRITPHIALLGHRTAYNPFHEIGNAAVRDGFMAVRLIGLALLAPFIEEAFYRAFLLRFIDKPDDWETVPNGRFTTTSLAANVAIFALSHPEWLSAAVFGAAMCFLLKYTGDARACVIAHATTNLALGAYVLTTGSWQYW